LEPTLQWMARVAPTFWRYRWFQLPGRQRLLQGCG